MECFWQMLKSKSVLVKWNAYTKKYYEQKGYNFTKFGHEFDVKIQDVMESSTARVDVICDYCNTEYNTEFRKFLKNHKKGNLGKDSCRPCGYKKLEETNMVNFGVPHTMKRTDVARKTGDTLKTPFSKVLRDFSNMGYELLSASDEFLNYQSKLRYICSTHRDFGAQTSTYSILRRGGCCKKCRFEKIGNKLRSTLEDATKEFNMRGYTLLDDEYINNSMPMRYICPIHPDAENKMCLANLKSGQGCPLCFNERRKQNPSNWNGGVTNLRKHLREQLNQ